MAEIVNDGFATLGAWTNVSTGTGTAVATAGNLVLSAPTGTNRGWLRKTASIATMADGDVFTVQGVNTGGGQFYAGVYLDFSGSAGTDRMPTLQYTGDRWAAGYIRTRDTPLDVTLTTYAAADGKMFARLRRSGSTLIAETSATYGGSYTTFATLAAADGFWGFGSWASVLPNFWSLADSTSISVSFASVGDGTDPGGGGGGIANGTRTLMAYLT